MCGVGCANLVRGMGRPKARFRISIKDNERARMLKVELIECRGLWGERRFQLRVNGRKACRIKVAALTEIFERLRRWMVARR